jgi:hypothetical protein
LIQIIKEVYSELKKKEIKNLYDKVLDENNAGIEPKLMCEFSIHPNPDLELPCEGVFQAETYL